MCYYAEYRAYGVNVTSEADTLMRFETREERDEMVSLINCLRGEELALSVTTREVERRYDLRKFVDDPWGIYCHEVDGLRTCAGRTFFEICQRPNYRY